MTLASYAMPDINANTTKQLTGDPSACFINSCTLFVFIMTDTKRISMDGNEREDQRQHLTTVNF